MRGSGVPLDTILKGKGFGVEIQRTLLGAGVRILWTQDLYTIDRRCYEDLAATLSTLHGVEACEMHRYSADLVIANHVIDTEPFVESLYAYLAEELAPLTAAGYNHINIDDRMDETSGFISTIGIPCS